MPSVAYHSTCSRQPFACLTVLLSKGHIFLWNKSGFATNIRKSPNFGSAQLTKSLKMNFYFFSSSSKTRVGGFVKQGIKNKWPYHH